MKKAEILLVRLTLIALVLKYFQIPFSGMIFVISTSILAMIYYPMGIFFFGGESFKDMFKGSFFHKLKGRKNFMAFLGGVSLAITLIGILFKLQMWPNGDLFLRLGLVLMAICAAIILFSYKKTSNSSNMILKRMILWGGIGIVVYLISTDTLIDHFYSERSEEYRELTKEYYNDLGNKELLEKIMEMDEEYYGSDTSDSE